MLPKPKLFPPQCACPAAATARDWISIRLHLLPLPFPLPKFLTSNLAASIFTKFYLQQSQLHIRSTRLFRGGWKGPAAMGQQAKLSSFFQVPKRLRANSGAGIALPHISAETPLDHGSEGQLDPETVEGEGLLHEPSEKVPLQDVSNTASALPLDTLPLSTRPRPDATALQAARAHNREGEGEEQQLDSSPGVPEERDPTALREGAIGSNGGQPWEPPLSPKRKVRCEVNRALALARRATRVAEERAAEAKAQGLSFPELEALLVESSWQAVLAPEFRKAYMEQLSKFVRQEAAGKVPIYPPPACVFRAFNSCPFDQIKVVIIGQDPYHGPGQAMGLSFSVPEGLRCPSSLLNIYKEIHADLGCRMPHHGNLDKWAAQGVLLLNTVLTVRGGQANSHSRKGWEAFTDAALRALTQRRTGLVVLLWGAHAQEKGRMIDRSRHHLLTAPHPSGLSAHRGFIGCRHFSKANALLESMGKTPIDWQL